MKSNFLITRFTHGSGGKFLSSILQTSTSVQHWNAKIESSKNQNNYTQLVQDYFIKCFPYNHSIHLQKEPMVSYNTDLYSTSYSRGNNISFNQYIEYSIKNKDLWFLKSIKNNQLCNLIFNKPNLPLFCKNAKAVTILIETDKEVEWLEKTLWSKHFLEIDRSIYYLPNHPAYCHKNSLSNVLKYKNPYKFDIIDKDKIYQEFIKNNHTRQWYTNKSNFNMHDKENNLDNIFIPLYTFFDSNCFCDAIKQIFNKFNLDNYQLELIKSLHSIWLKRQHTF